jgi:hypothetical protein
MITDTTEDTTGRRRSTRVAVGLALLIAIGVVAAAIVIAGNASSSPAKDAPGKVTGATSVERRNLVQTDTQSGTLSYANPQTVYNRLTGTVTWLPAVGQLIRPGQALYRVDGQPVVLLNGTTPAYRALKSSDSAGPDILELNNALLALGYTGYGIVADDLWQAATTSAVEAFQQSQGESPTGKLGLGQVVFLPGAQLVSTLDGTLGQTGSGGGTPPTSNASTAVAPPAPEFVSLTHPVDAPTTGPTGSTGTTGTTGTAVTPSHNGGHHRKKKGATGAQTLQALEALLRAQLAALHAAAHNGSPSGSKSPSGSNSPSSSPPATGSTGNHSPSTGNHSPSGGGVSSGTAILQTSSTKLVVTVDLAASSQSEAVVGEHVTVQMPNGGTVAGKITAVSPVAQAASSNSGNGNGNGNGNGGGGNGNGNGNGASSTIPVTVTLKGRHRGAGLDQATVSVNFAQARARNVLSVPVTALLATGGGNYAVQAAARPHRLIPATVGLFAAGFVQISGPGIYPGLSVTDSQG